MASAVHDKMIKSFDMRESSRDLPMLLRVGLASVTLRPAPLYVGSEGH